MKKAEKDEQVAYTHYQSLVDEHTAHEEEQIDEQTDLALSQSFTDQHLHTSSSLSTVSTSTPSSQPTPIKTSKWATYEDVSTSNYHKQDRCYPWMSFNSVLVRQVN